jgi:hypothetical protein
VVAADGRLQSRTLDLGLEAPDRVEVRHGLAAGDLVVIGSRARLKAGGLVTAKPIDLQAAEGAR